MGLGRVAGGDADACVQSSSRRRARHRLAPVNAARAARVAEPNPQRHTHGQACRSIHSTRPATNPTPSFICTTPPALIARTASLGRGAHETARGRTDLLPPAVDRGLNASTHLDPNRPGRTDDHAAANGWHHVVVLGLAPSGALVGIGVGGRHRAAAATDDHDDDDRRAPRHDAAPAAAGAAAGAAARPPPRPARRRRACARPRRR